ncbi:hypothetical protein [Pelagicoccus sp. SDUM812003]|uniref:hypothetical protein n=1 Tax=Pelagicoccus sp. SDUM812003 TaxID=3041267 RepID=UPI00280D4323|nr:hypothetical protein [Pelagicoccus sp. SDUM812003]MDQ8203755.1 hypothetical protein [Pelagicoccus sp. SDUM812003]
MKNRSQLLGLTAACTLVASLGAAELLSPFEALPAETVAALRFDNSPETLDRYVETTKIGKLLLSDEKVEQYKAFVQKLIEDDDEGVAVLQSLGEVGLELDDLYAMLTSEIGAAVVMQEVPDHQAMPTLFVWADMEEGVAKQAFDAVLSGAAENEAVERTDLELPGAAGSRIRNKETGSSFLVSSLENRFYFAIGQVMEPITSMEDAQLFENAELEALGVFLAAQQGDGGEFLSSFYSDPAINAVRPDFEPRIEVLGDVGALLEFVPQKGAQFVEALDLKSFTKLAAWSGLVDMEERSTLFLGAPSPRRGLAALIDGESFEFQPPEWVPASVNTFSAFSFDLNEVYQLLLDIAKKFAPPEVVEQQVAQLNAQLGMMLQTDMDTLLSSFGKRAYVAEFPVETLSIDLGTGASMEVAKAPQVIVMDFSRPEILQAGLAMMGGMLAGNPNAGIEIIDEQGFSGIRSSSGPQGVVTVAHGMGKLVFAVGGDTTASRIFSALNSVPEGEEALVNDPEFREYLSQNPVKPGVAFSVTRGDKALQNMIPALETLSKTMQASGQEDQHELFEELIDLLPTKEELDGLLGIGLTRMYFNEAGLVVEGVSQYK